MEGGPQKAVRWSESDADWIMALALCIGSAAGAEPNDTICASSTSEYYYTIINTFCIIYGVYHFA